MWWRNLGRALVAGAVAVAGAAAGPAGAVTPGAAAGPAGAVTPGAAGAVISGADGAVTPGLDLKIAKTRLRVIPFGTMTPGAPGESVRLTLWHALDGEFQRVARRTVETRVGDGPLETSFQGSFDRPKRGNCRVRAVHRDGLGNRTVEQETFACFVPRFDLGTAILTPAGGQGREITALLADTPRRRGYGLMYRRRLAQDRGMAFLWKEDTSGGFWMKNTHIPLSIAFYDSGGMILEIMDMEPCEADPCPTYDPGVSYRGALEVNQGAFSDWGISEGDRIEIRR